MKKVKAKKETGTDFLARLMANGFEEVKVEMKTRFDEVDYRLLSLEKGQTETHRRLDSIEKKQSGT